MTRNSTRIKTKNNQTKNYKTKNEETKNDEIEEHSIEKNESKMKIDKQEEIPIKKSTTELNKDQEEEEKEKEKEKEKDENKSSNTTTQINSNTLFELIGHNMPCLSLETLIKRPGYSSKPSTSSSTPSPRWVLAPFQNPARTDELKLKHWVRSDDHQVYRFAKFNTTSNVFSYTTEEYYHFLRDDDWTKEETDYLFNLLNTYDLRFPIVHDRYEFLASHERSLDDLKARYYSICQRLIQHRPSTSGTDESNKKQSLIQSYNFDKQREIERKKHVQSLLNRSKSQLIEEEFIYIETRRLEQNLLKRIRNRNELMKLIGGYHHEMLNELKFWPPFEQNPPQLPRQSNHNHSSGVGTVHPAIQSKKNHNNLRRSETLEQDISTSGGGDEPDSNSSKISSANIVIPQVQIEQDRKNCIHRLDSSSYQSHATGSMATSSTGGSHYRSVGLRSTRITLPKTVAASSRISAMMNELKIPSLLNYLPKPLMIPNRENVESYERLIQAINQLVDLKRVVDRVESDLKNQRKKLDSFVNNNHHHYHHPNLNMNSQQSNSSSSHRLVPVKSDSDHNSSTAILPNDPTDNTTSQLPAPKLESIEPELNVQKIESPTVSPIKLLINKKRSASVASSCSNKTAGDPSINPPDQSSSNINKTRNHSSNSRKKIRKI